MSSLCTMRGSRVPGRWVDTRTQANKTQRQGNGRSNDGTKETKQRTDKGRKEGRKGRTHTKQANKRTPKRSTTSRKRVTELSAGVHHAYTAHNAQDKHLPLLRNSEPIFSTPRRQKTQRKRWLRKDLVERSFHRPTARRFFVWLHFPRCRETQLEKFARGGVVAYHARYTVVVVS